MDNGVLDDLYVDHLLGDWQNDLWQGAVLAVAGQDIRARGCD